MLYPKASPISLSYLDYLIYHLYLLSLSISLFPSLPPPPRHKQERKKERKKMEIDDILATITHHGPSDPLSDSSSSQSDYALLTKFWVAERSAPDLLPWPTSLMDRINSRISSQVGTPPFPSLAIFELCAESILYRLRKLRILLLQLQIQQQEEEQEQEQGT